MTNEEYKIVRQYSLEMTQKQLADRLGVTRATINRRETKRGDVSEEARLAIKSLVVIHQIEQEGEPLECVGIEKPEWERKLTK